MKRLDPSKTTATAGITTALAGGCPASAGSPSSCLQCQHHREYMTHLTATVRCGYPRERAPEVVDATIFLHGNAVMPIKTAAICPHFEENTKGEAQPPATRL